MNKSIIYISDFFLEDVCGGAELNDAELISMFSKKSYSVFKIRSNKVTVSFLNKNKHCFFIVSNFINLSMDCRNHLTDLNYIIYEHDHKYLKKRNPLLYKDFKAPKHEIVNYFFYKNARKIICQSSYHKKILVQNLSLKNVINISGNLWSTSTLKKIRAFSKNDKQEKCSILESNIRHKNTSGSIKYCLNKNLDYQLIKGKYVDFLSSMSKNKKFIFFPKSPETLSRVVVEARMLGCSVIVNQLVGASHEKWFKLKGEDLIDYMLNKRIEIFNTIEKVMLDSVKETERPLVSIISTFYKAEEFLNGFLEDLVSQTIFDKCELIVVDSGSPGEEKEIMKKYCEKYDNIKYIRYEERFPPTMGHNIAMQNSSSKYITWAMIDDRKDPKFLETLYNELEKNKEIDLVYGDCLVTSNKNETLKETESKNLSEHSIPEFSHENMIKCLPGPMPMWTTRMIDKVGFFNNVEYFWVDDWELWLRSVSEGCVFKKINKVVGLYLTGGRSQNENNILKYRKEEAKIFFKYKHVFGSNYAKYFSYFDQFVRMTND